MSEKEITSTDIAAMRKVTRKTARAILQRIADEHGPSVVTMRGRKLVTTKKAIARFLPDVGEDDPDQRAAVAELRERMAAVEETIRSLLAFKKLASPVIHGRARMGSDGSY